LRRSPLSSELTWARPLGVLSGQDDDLRVVRDRRHGVTLADVNDPTDPYDAFLVRDLCRNALREPLPRNETGRRARRVLDVGLRHHAVGGVRRGSPRTVASSVGGRVGSARGGVEFGAVQLHDRFTKALKAVIELPDGRPTNDNIDVAGVEHNLAGLAVDAFNHLWLIRDVVPIRNVRCWLCANIGSSKVYYSSLAVDAFNSAPATTRPRCRKRVIRTDGTENSVLVPEHDGRCHVTCSQSS